jgi:hypothetical protein
MLASTRLLKQPTCQTKNLWKSLMPIQDLRRKAAHV